MRVATRIVGATLAAVPAIHVGLRASAVHSPSSAGRDLGLLFDVDMDELSRMRGGDASDHSTGSAIEICESTDAVALQNSMQRRSRDACSWGEPRRSELMTPAQLDDPSFGSS